MNTNPARKTVFILAVLLTGTASALLAQVPPSGGSATPHGDPFNPVGFIRVTPTVVQPGVQPEMTWGIEFPKSIPDLVVIDNNDGLTTINDKTDKVNVRVAGVSSTISEKDLDTALWIRVNNGSWELIFYGSETDINSVEPVYTRTVQTGTKIDFAARTRTSQGSWSPIQWTIDNSPGVRALVDEDPLPTDTPAFVNGQVESFMSQFIESDSEIVAGPRDVLHLFELHSTDPGDPNFDCQDLVIITTFGKNNNGHGNNLDGVDVSNPGQGGGGPNGEEDPSGYVDDERGKIKKK